MQNLEALTDVLAAAHRLGRVVARTAGSTTPAAQWRALSILEESGPLRLGALASAARVTQPGMTRLVDLMSGAGLVEKAPDPADARAVVIRITDAGRDARDDWFATVRQVLAPRFADLTDDDWRAIHTTAALLNARTAEPTNGVE
ncbi:MarR family winged helix-turn-helix transcriptional regulator [Microbacterium sp. JZ31]|uniref:MarR family winged helix-turn-helix transcriptional regulator n=1 Tax=Microbacterium sp. JZ31 TaxID=1906274 RepID=UPI0019325AD9|nr:MarR family transcriptional regulator [Microbacterium sp. JZ31]